MSVLLRDLQPFSVSSSLTVLCSEALFPEISSASFYLRVAPAFDADGQIVPAAGRDAARGEADEVALAKLLEDADKGVAESSRRADVQEPAAGRFTEIAQERRPSRAAGRRSVDYGLAPARRRQDRRRAEKTRGVCAIAEDDGQRPSVADSLSVIAA